MTPHLPTIRLLPPTVIAQIAAGEVIDRPATIVKELLENALDAGANQITIRLTNGGLTKLVITDNGHGMAADQLALAVQRHATSKISTVTDLARLHSYGFRGEALASIATVARLTLRSRPHPADSAEPSTNTGQELVVHHGQTITRQPVGMPPGTQVWVEELFARVPARRKFLASANVERQAILQTVTQFALAVPEVGWTVTDGSQLCLAVPPQQTLLERVAQLLGSSFATQLWPVAAEFPDWRYTGLLGTPQVARRSRATQLIVVNRRPISDPAIAAVVRTAYASGLELKSQPSFLLFIDVAPELIDVNVHPRKESVSWQQRTTMLNELRQSLITKITVQSPGGTTNDQLLTATVPELATATTTVTDTQQKPPADQTDQPPWVLADSQPLPLAPQFVHTLPQLHRDLKAAAPSWQHALATRERTILQVHLTYLITETSSGILVVDQHAAHERVLYQRFLNILNDQVAVRQSVQLDPPPLLTFPPALANLLPEELPLLNQLGYEIEAYGQQRFLVRQVPAILQDQAIQDVLEAVLQDLADGVHLAGIEELAHRTLAYLACRSAVKAGDPLTEAQAETLLTQLQATPYAFSCPHGRPTLQTFTWAQVGKWFQRK